MRTTPTATTTPWILIALLALSLGALFPYFEDVRNANERPRLLQAMSVVDTGEWHINGPGGRGFHTGPDISRSPVSGKLVPNKPPGGTLVGLAAYPLGRAVHGKTYSLRDFTYWARILAGWLPTVLLLLWAVRRYGPRGDGLAAHLAVAMYALATPAFAYSHLFYGHQLAALCLFGGVVLLVDGKRQHVVWKCATGGLLAGTAVLVEYGAAFAGVPIGLALLLGAGTRPGRHTVAASIAGAAIPLLGLLYYHQQIYGSPWETGYHHVVNAGFAAKHGQGFLGLGLPTARGFQTHFFSPGGGLLWWAPLFPLAIYGLIREVMDSQDQFEGGLFLSIFVLLALIGTSLSFDGGWRIGPRYLVVALPALIPGWTRAFSELRRGPAWAVIAALALWSVVLNSTAGNLWPHMDLSGMELPWSDLLRPMLLSGLIPYTGFGLPDVLAVFLCLVPCLVLLATILRHAEDCWTWCLLGFFVTFCFLVLAPPSDHPKRERNLDYIERVYEPDVDRLALPSARLPPLSRP